MLTWTSHCIEDPCVIIVKALIRQRSDRRKLICKRFRVVGINIEESKVVHAVDSTSAGFLVKSDFGFWKKYHFNVQGVIAIHTRQLKGPQQFERRKTDNTTDNIHANLVSKAG